MTTLSREFDLTFAPGYLENVQMIDLGTKERTPLYTSSLTLPMVRPRSRASFLFFVILTTVRRTHLSWSRPLDASSSRVAPRPPCTFLA